MVVMVRSNQMPRRMPYARNSATSTTATVVGNANMKVVLIVLYW